MSTKPDQAQRQPVRLRQGPGRSAHRPALRSRGTARRLHLCQRRVTPRRSSTSRASDATCAAAATAVAELPISASVLVRSRDQKRKLNTRRLVTGVHPRPLTIGSAAVGCGACWAAREIFWFVRFTWSLSSLLSGLQMPIEPLQRFTDVIGPARLVLSKKQKVRPMPAAGYSDQSNRDTGRH